MPPQASEDSLEGAAAFVKHYVDVFNYAAATGDVQELSRLSAPTCDGCQRYISKFKDIYENGDRISQKLWTLTSDDLLVDKDNRISAAMSINEGKVKNYRFIFDLPANAPYVVENLTRGVSR